MVNDASLMSEAVRCNQVNKFRGVRGGDLSGFRSWLPRRLSRR